LDNKTVKNILKEEGFDSKEIEFASKYVSLPYEIVQLKNNKNLGIPVKETIVRWINIETDKILYIIRENLDKKKEILNVLSLFKNKMIINSREIDDSIFETIKLLIGREILFYDMINGIVKPTSLIEWEAIKKFLEI
jgi:hypothetical protein